MFSFSSLKIKIERKKLNSWAKQKKKQMTGTEFRRRYFDKRNWTDSNDDQEHFCNMQNSRFLFEN